MAKAFAEELFECVRPFMGSAFKGVKRNIFRKYLFHSTKKEVQIREQFYVPKAICNDSNSVFLVL